MNSLKTGLFVLLALSLFTLGLPWTFKETIAQASSRVYFANPAVCCTPGSSGTVSFTVKMDLGSGERINAFDVRIDYSNFSSVLDAQSVDPTGNVFGGQSATVLAYCADGTS